MLGFVFGRRPNAAAHVNYIRKKFFGKLWIIRHLIKAGIEPPDLLAVYTAYILPVVEYCNVVYHCLLNNEMSDDLENMQRIALRAIYGRGMSYSQVLQQSGLRSLKDRREEAFRKFAIKTESNERFSAAWLTKNPTDRGLRNTEKYRLTRSKFDRLTNGPLNEMRRILNLSLIHI